MSARGRTGLIGRIYDAVVDEGSWPGLLATLADDLGGSGSVLVSTDLDKGESRILASANLDPAYVASYGAHYFRLDPWTEPYAALPPGAVACTDERLPRRQLQRTEFYGEWLRPQGIARSLGGVITRDDATMLRIGIPRGTRQGPFERRQLTRLRSALPHVRRAWRLHQQLSEVSQALGASAAAFDRLPFGVILVNGEAQVVMMNEAARAIVDDGDGLHLRDGKLGALRAADDGALDRLIAAVAGAAPSEGPVAVGGVTVSRRSGVQRFPVVAAALAGPSGGEARDGPAAALFLGAAGGGHEISDALLRRLYGLSRREAELASLLAAGESLDTAAGRLGLAKSTVRKYLEQINRKTGTTRQAELVALLLSSPAGLFRKS